MSKRLYDDQVCRNCQTVSLSQVEIDRNIYNRFKIMCDTNDDGMEEVISWWMEFVVTNHEHDYSDFLDDVKQEYEQEQGVIDV